MTAEENGRLARIEAKLDTVVDNVKIVCGTVGDPETGMVAHEQRIRAVEARSKSLLAVNTAILVTLVGWIIIKMFVVP
jgi:hypothetical protein